MGVSGAAAARLLLDEGSDVVAVDSRDTAEVATEAGKLEEAGAGTLAGCEVLPAGGFDVCIVSPGIAVDSEWMQEIGSRGIPVLPELELGASRCGCPVLAVTGSNGKSTMVKLCGDALSLAGKRVALGGNYGRPLSELARGSDGLDRIVAELSSFQLETVRNFRPDVGVVLNIQPDHLDRHADMAAYARAKSALFDSMSEGDTGIVFEDDAERVAKLSRGRNRWVSFGTGMSVDYRYADGRVTWTEAGGVEKCLSVESTVFANDVMGLTVAATTAAVRACGEDGMAVARAAADFEPLAHRMQLVAEAGDVAFVDDSKATNISALKGALRMCPGPVRLVAGGLLKEGGLETAAELLAGKATGIYLVGAAAEEMASAWGEAVKCELCGDLETAVRRAWADGVAGETILLSPGCASFDQFRNFEERGEKFTELARQLADERH